MNMKRVRMTGYKGLRVFELFSHIFSKGKFMSYVLQYSNSLCIGWRFNECSNTTNAR